MTCMFIRTLVLIVKSSLKAILIVLEVNTSSLRNGLVELMPGVDILMLYCAEGGKYVTVGSDAHIAADLAAGYTIAHERLRGLGLREVIFVNRTIAT